MSRIMTRKKRKDLKYVTSGIGGDSNVRKVSRGRKVRKPKRAPRSRGSGFRGGGSFSAKWKSIKDLPKPNLKKRKPRILLLADVYGWAWWHKSKQIKKHLENKYDIDIVNLLGPNRKSFDTNKYDIYVTFGYSYIGKLEHVTHHKKVTGVTAHRPRPVIESQMKKAAVVHANSVLLWRELSQIHNIAYYLPNGVDHNLFKIKKPIPPKRKKLIVGHVGKLSPRKGQKEFIEPAVKKAGKNIKYVSHYNSYKNSIPLKKMVDIYQGIDVFICASKEDGTPNPALEAAACGRPIISNRIGNMPEFIKDGYNGFLVDKEVDAYVEKIEWLSNNRDALIEMGRNARKTVEEEWAWEKQVKNWERMFDDILY